MKSKPVAALLGPLAAFVALAAFSAYSSLGHLDSLSSNDKALVCVAIGALGVVALLVGAAGTGSSGRGPREAKSSAKSAAGELAQRVEQFLSEAVPEAVQAALDNPGAPPPALPALEVAGPDEVARLANAFRTLAAAAVELAADQAGLHQRFTEAFLNLGRRNQNLVTRQLEYISELELGEADPKALDELFRLDHLATRMRRNAESLLILAGSGPAGQWDAPVPAMDIARAASAEVEDYKRLRLHHFDPAMVSGSVTTDLVHILAELMENSLTYSPPGSPVDVYGRFLEGGYVIVIVDVGIGMPEQDLATANRRLAGESSEGELPGRYLGHFVAGRLAARHAVSASLQPSQSGGLVARVKIPSKLVEDTPADTPDLPASQTPPTQVLATQILAAQIPSAQITTADSPAAHLAPAAGPALPPREPSLALTNGERARPERALAEPARPVPVEAVQPVPVQAVQPEPVPAPAPAGTLITEPGAVDGAPVDGAPVDPAPAERAPEDQAPEDASPASEPAWDPIEVLRHAGGHPATPGTPDLGSLAPLAGHSPRHLAGPEARPAAQARSTADALRRLTRRVPGASLTEEDGALKRSTPAEEGLNSSGLTSALSQYLAVTTAGEAAGPSAHSAHIGWEPGAGRDEPLDGALNGALDNGSIGGVAHNGTEHGYR